MRRSVFTALFFLWCLPAMADITLDATSSGTITSGTTVTFSHTCTGTNLVLAVYAVSRAGAANYPSSITYNAVSMTEDTSSRNNQANSSGSWWYLVNPATGANNIVVTYGSTRDEAMIFGVSYTGAKQSGQPVTRDADGGFNTGAWTLTSAVTTTATNQMILMGAMDYVGGTANLPTIDSPFTSRKTDSTFTDYKASISDYLEPTATSQNCQTDHSAFHSASQSVIVLDKIGRRRDVVIHT